MQWTVQLICIIHGGDHTAYDARLISCDHKMFMTLTTGCLPLPQHAPTRRGRHQHRRRLQGHPQAHKN